VLLLAVKAVSVLRPGAYVVRNNFEISCVETVHSNAAVTGIFDMKFHVLGIWSPNQEPATIFFRGDGTQQTCRPVGK
jgi:hypothetical protein